MSSNVNAGIAIAPLQFKDDSFRVFNWSATSGTLVTNGDEITVYSSQTVIRSSINPSIAAATVNSLDVRCRAVNTKAQLTVKLLDSNATTLLTQNIVVSSTTYGMSFTTFSVTVPISQISLSSNASDSIMVDFIALESSSLASIFPQGTEFHISFDKKTISQPIPFSTDLIQQLGIASRTTTINVTKDNRNVYNSIEALITANTPVLVNGPSLEMTGYVSNVTGELDAGVVPPAYDVTITITKGDQDVV